MFKIQELCGWPDWPAKSLYATCMDSFFFQFSYQPTFIVQSSGFYRENFIQVHHVCIDIRVQRETWPVESETLTIVIPSIHKTQGQVKFVKNW